MLKSKKAVILTITVFLMLNFGGCYTKLKHPQPSPGINDANGINRDWDFGNGWHTPHLEIYPEFYSYYYIQWWNDCPWCDDNTDVEYEKDESIKGKINHRDEADIPSGVFTYTFPVNSFSQESTGSIQPKNQISEPKQSSNNNKTAKNKSIKKKVKNE